ncbi:MAG: sulfite exporter TauE/SafE family protein [Brucellaceae bacterium]|nr:sulfite exporter TauE/SafE family protein [Brucellaceae bacterium]
MPTFDTPLLILLGCVLVAGTAKGLSGFGTGMIVAPIAGALYGPKTALIVIVIIDALPSIPVTIPVLRIALWREVIPVFVGLFLTVPIGVLILKHGDPTVLRWIISVAILICVAALWSGWRYRGPRGMAVSGAVGGVAGILSGIASIPGPPVIVYWLASGLASAIVRANLLSLFFLGTLVSFSNIWFAGLFEPEAVTIALTVMPVYFAGILAGWALFGLATERAYRAITFVMIVAAAILALPALDGVFRAVAGAFAG